MIKIVHSCSRGDLLRIQIQFLNLTEFLLCLGLDSLRFVPCFLEISKVLDTWSLLTKQLFSLIGLKIVRFELIKTFTDFLNVLASLLLSNLDSDLDGSFVYRFNVTIFQKIVIH